MKDKRDDAIVAVQLHEFAKAVRGATNGLMAITIVSRAESDKDGTGTGVYVAIDTGGMDDTAGFLTEGIFSLVTALSQFVAGCSVDLSDADYETLCELTSKSLMAKLQVDRDSRKATYHAYTADEIIAKINDVSF